MTPQVVIRMDVGEFIALVLISAAVLIAAALAIGQLYRVSRRLRFQGRQHDDILGRLPVGVLLVNAKGERTFANGSANVLLERIDPQLIDQVLHAAVKDAQSTSVLQGANSTVIQLQAQYVGPAQHADQLLLLTLQDLSLQQQAETNQRKFIHTLSHELLTPFTALQLRLATLETQDETERRQALHMMRDDVERLTRLTSNLLLLSRLDAQQPLQRHITNLSAVIEEAVLQLMPRAQARQIAITIQTGLDVQRPRIDRDAFKQVFLNLIDNGIKYGVDGGKIDISVQQQEAGLQICVADNGMGINADDLPHIFTEMFRADGHRHIAGTGLGLAIVRRIVERHGGQIICNSEPGAGAAFIITLPLDVTEP